MQMRIVINTVFLSLHRVFAGSPLGTVRTVATTDQCVCPRQGASWLALVPMLSLLLAVGCTTAPQVPTPPARYQTCLDFYRALDRTVTAAGVRDAGARVVPDYPYLRVDRLLASYRDELEDAQVYRTWLTAMAENDLLARRLELANLAPARRDQLSGEPSQDLEQRLARCSNLLRELPGYHSGHRPRLLQAAAVPDNYLTWQRVLGLYPLARPIALDAIERLQQRLERPFLEPPQPQGVLSRYQPREGYPVERLSGQPKHRQVALNPLGVPQVPADLLHHLFRRFAPVLEVDTRNDADRIGRVRWRVGGQAEVDTGDPLVYLYPGYTRFQGQVLLQLNYLFWFPARDTGDIYAGRFDALIWRVTLNEHFRPMAYDSIHGCGCYYHLFAAPGYRLTETPAALEPVLSPVPAPALAPSQRILLRLAAARAALAGESSDGRRVGGATAGECRV